MDIWVSQGRLHIRSHRINDRTRLPNLSFDDDSVAMADRAAGFNAGINANRGEGSPGKWHHHAILQNTFVHHIKIAGQITLRKDRHDATWTGVSDGQAHRVSNADCFANPVVFNKAILIDGVNDDVGSKAAAFEPSLWI